MDVPHRHSRNQKYISSLQLLVWDWDCLNEHPSLQIKFRWDRNSTQSTVLRLSGSNSALGGESNTSYVRHGTNFHSKIIICSVTNGYCKIFINLSAYKNCEFLIQSSIWLLNFILSLARSLGMWLQSKLKSNHMWITFPHECNDFRRLINVKQCLSYGLYTFPGERCKRADSSVSWFNFLSIVFQGDLSQHIMGSACSLGQGMSFPFAHASSSCKTLSL